MGPGAGITGLWQPSVHSDVAFWSFDVGSSYHWDAEVPKCRIVHPPIGSVSWVLLTVSSALWKLLDTQRSSTHLFRQMCCSHLTSQARGGDKPSANELAKSRSRKWREWPSCYDPLSFTLRLVLICLHARSFSIFGVRTLGQLLEALVERWARQTHWWAYEHQCMNCASFLRLQGKRGHSCTSTAVSDIRSLKVNKTLGHSEWSTA